MVSICDHLTLSAELTLLALGDLGRLEIAAWALAALHPASYLSVLVPLQTHDSSLPLEPILVPALSVLSLHTCALFGQLPDFRGCHLCSVCHGPL